MLRLRTAQRDDAQLLRALLYEAAFWRSNVARPQRDEALTNPELARYIEGFGRPGDFGIVAEEGAERLGRRLVAILPSGGARLRLCR